MVEVETGVDRASPRRRRSTVERYSFLAGMAAGAALTFILDPSSGRRRRALVRDKFVRAQRTTRAAADAAVKDVSNRARGVAAATRSMLRDEAVDAPRLVERVRATLGRATSHPRAIDVVAADGGAVILEGPILTAEAERVLSAAWSVPGVARVIDHLQRHETPEGVPSLQ
jgi:osmotically-inducible protein OsmY